MIQLSIYTVELKIVLTGLDQIENCILFETDVYMISTRRKNLDLRGLTPMLSTTRVLKDDCDGLLHISLQVIRYLCYHKPCLYWLLTQIEVK